MNHCQKHFLGQNFQGKKEQWQSKEANYRNFRKLVETPWILISEQSNKHPLWRKSLRDDTFTRIKIGLRFYALGSVINRIFLTM